MLDPSSMMSVSLRPSVARVLHDCERILKPMSRASVPSLGNEMAVAWMGDDIIGSRVFRFQRKQGQRMRARTRHN
jgi:hypothetical protein